MTKIPKNAAKCDICGGNGYLWQYQKQAEEKAKKVVNSLINGRKK